LYSLFNKIRDKGRTVSAWKAREGGEEGEMTQTLYAHLNKQGKKKKQKTTFKASPGK
jgi:hypothetical protein